MTAPATTRELLWLACRQKTCCHGARVIVSGRDLWRIATALEAAPWDFTRYAPAEAGAADAFRLEPEGPMYQVVLAKRGRVTSRGAPCVFLWKLGDGHAQCGLGATRPLVCQAYPAAMVDGLLCAEGRGCTCRRWSVLDLDRDRDAALLGAAQCELAEYSEIVAAWNDGPAAAGARTYRDFCSHVMAAYAGRS